MQLRARSRIPLDGSRSAWRRRGDHPEREALGAGVAKALLGKDVLPDDLPFVTGAIGLPDTKPSYDLMAGCDTLLLVATGFPWAEFLPKDGRARAVQIDVDPAMLGLRYPVEVNLQGDATETLQELLPRSLRKTDRSWQQPVHTASKLTTAGRKVSAAKR